MDMDRSDLEARATATGLRVTTSVSSKTALVVTADPYSQSGKTSTARKLGIRLVTEQVFLHQLAQLQDASAEAMNRCGCRHEQHSPPR
jgi:DNA polymerase-3 subunit epsilon